LNILIEFILIGVWFFLSSSVNLHYPSPTKHHPPPTIHYPLSKPSTLTPNDKQFSWERWATSGH